jgi:hypothetical protein
MGFQLPTGKNRGARVQAATMAKTAIVFKWPDFFACAAINHGGFQALIRVPRAFGCTKLFCIHAASRRVLNLRCQLVIFWRL